MKTLFNLLKKKPKEATLVLNPKGINTIGGKLNSEIELPELETSPMVYFGFISKNETALELIDFDLHLICPIFIDLQTSVFFDYSDSKKPRLIRNNVTSNLSQLFEDIPHSTYIEYKELNFSFNKSKKPKLDKVYDGEIGHSGVPNWIHDEDWPNCPITGNKMKFLFQLGDIDDCETIVGQEILDKEYIDPYLHFGHGYLYVFYEPESKVIAYLNQL
ncbi:hypothetical protein MHTCC0001_09480 [Flavobacteriaceae bacterium MHTCC 0001]